MRESRFYLPPDIKPRIQRVLMAITGLDARMLMAIPIIVFITAHQVTMVLLKKCLTHIRCPSLTLTRYPRHQNAEPNAMPLKYHGCSPSRFEDCDRKIASPRMMMGLICIHGSRLPPILLLIRGRRR